MLGAQGLHQLDVHGLIAVGGEDTQVSLAPEEKAHTTVRQTSKHHMVHGLLIPCTSERHWVTSGSFPQRLQ